MKKILKVIAFIGMFLMVSSLCASGFNEVHATKYTKRSSTGNITSVVTGDSIYLFYTKPTYDLVDQDPQDIKKQLVQSVCNDPSTRGILLRKKVRYIYIYPDGVLTVEIRSCDK